MTAVLDRPARIQDGDDELYEIPSEASLDGEFTPAPDLERIASRLIMRHSLNAQAQCRITYLWKDKGGQSKGRATLGKCTKPSGLLRHFSEADFVIWLAADHLRLRSATATDVEAVVFHELLHIGESEEEDTEGEVKLMPHDNELFIAELEHYGTRVRDLRAFVRTVQQLPLELA